MRKGVYLVSMDPIQVNDSEQANKHRKHRGQNISFQSRTQATCTCTVLCTVPVYRFYTVLVQLPFCMLCVVDELEVTI